MSTDLNSSFNEQYMNINTKLKKRFMRKPNISEATNEFNGLGIQCEHSEQPTFAGHAYIGAAKCENSAGNFLGEAEYYLTAARQFMKAEMKLSALKCFSPVRENLEAAIGCYIQALNKYPENSPLRTSILLEISKSLVILNHKLEAISYYEQALETIKEMNDLKLKCLWNLLNLNVQTGQFENALDIANTITDSTITIPHNILTEIQVNRVLLTLIIEPIDEKKPTSLNMLFQHLLNDDEDEVLPFSADLKLKLQSIIISYSNKDIEALIEESADTKKYLTLMQHDMLVQLTMQLDGGM